MQAACWMGRGDHSDLGGVSAHLYAEFDGQAIELPRLVAALGRLGREHAMLRACVTADGMQALAAADKAPHLEWRISPPWRARRWRSAWKPSASSGLINGLTWQPVKPFVFPSACLARAIAGCMWTRT